MIAQVLERAGAGERLGEEEGVRLLREAPLLELGRAADEVRRRLHPDNRVTFVVDRNINYSNICTMGCRFCAFHRLPGDPEGYVLSREEIFEKIREAVELGATQILMQGGINPDLDLAWFEELLSSIRERFPVHIHSLSPPEVAYLARREKLPVRTVLERLRRAGLASVPGGGAEILDDRVRREISPRKIDTAAWLAVMREAHLLGMRSSATMMFGTVETDQELVRHLLRLRQLQDETGGFTAFIPWSFQPGNTDLGGEEASGQRYLRVLAVSRLILDNIPNLQVSWVTQGAAMAQVALYFGANDFGGTMLEENVVRAAGVDYRIPREEILRAIRETGRVPAKRDTLYRILEEYGANPAGPAAR